MTNTAYWTDKNKGNIYKVEKVIRHPDYDENFRDKSQTETYTDVALLKIEEKIKENYYFEKIPLGKILTTKGEFVEVTVAGWGSTTLEQVRQNLNIHCKKIICQIGQIIFFKNGIIFLFMKNRVGQSPGY